MTASSLSIAVVGSINLDLVARVQAFPLPGETVTDAKLDRHPGGKGGNQALAAQRLGASVSMVACLGTDSAADEALAQLKSEGVDLTHCRRLENESTGLAMIVVDAAGENQIVVAPGANQAFAPEHLALPKVDGVIAQLEVPMDTLICAAEQHDGFFCLNAAPARPVAEELLAHTDLLVVNELEAEVIGPRLADYTGWLAVTYGSAGAELMHDNQWAARCRAPRIEAIDTTGAGDAFTAALCVGMMEGLKPDEALRQACAAGAYAATQHGAQASPTRDDLKAFRLTQ